MQSISDRSLLLEQFGLRVELIGDDDALRVTPSSRITPAARDYIVANKAALRDRLLGNTTFTAVGDIAAGIVTAVAIRQPTPAPALPADLLERVNLICRLEQWPAADRAEWLGILRRQIEQDGTPVRELVACLDAHLAKHHAGVAGDDDREAFEERAAIMQHDGGLTRCEAEEQAAKVNECLTCLHWRGEATIPSSRQQVQSLVNPASNFRQNKVIGACQARYRPWRSSSDPAQSQYLQWIFIGQCAYTPAGKDKAA